MTGWDAADKYILQYIGGGAYSIALSLLAIFLSAFILWKLFKKPIKLWFTSIIDEKIDNKLKAVNERVDRHREELDSIKSRQREQDKEIAIMQRDHSSLNETLKKTVMPDIVRIKAGVDELHRILIEFNK